MNKAPVSRLIIKLFLNNFKWCDMLTQLWLRCTVYIIGDPKVMDHIMEVREVLHMPDSVAQAAPLSTFQWCHINGL